MEYSSKIEKDLWTILMLGLSETIDQLTMANSARVTLNGHVLRREDGYVFRRALDLEIERQRKKGGERGHGKSRLRKKVRRLA